jgi:hypothetical protein
MKLLWVTDPHLDKKNLETRSFFTQQIINSNPDFFISGGDLSDNFEKEISLVPNVTTFYVLGNHEYYGKSLNYLPEHPGYLGDGSVVHFSESTCLIGNGGWPDAGAGCTANADRIMLDFAEIEDFNNILPSQFIDLLKDLGNECVQYFENIIPCVLECYETVYVLTHIPVFQETCYSRNGPTTPEDLPYYLSKAVGDYFRFMMEGRSNNLIVLSGHTHFESRVQIESNILALVGEAGKFYEFEITDHI